MTEELAPDVPQDGGIRDLITELIRVPAKEIRANPKNWRKHPPRQRAVLEAMLQQVGFANAALAYYDEEGLLTLIDGHLRQETVDDDFEMPVLVLDVDEEGAEALLASLDPLAAMAEADQSALHEIANRLVSENDALADTFAALTEPYGVQVGFTDLPPPESAGDHGAGFDVAQIVAQMPKNAITEEIIEEFQALAEKHNAKFSVKGVRE